ncbi:Regulator of nonsense transcripts 1 [Strongyloides ratti]|uniref:Regulator of nonsense transcripts 1 n=1 Tax=Strongyloides ratti TaxID=34506 RepID=A0A090N009_STRRB|nr:Regulator of nonsense transcripts 1 [Strongyloides ratti]CEF69865.1 Regulator of nonsense transcripts 1 [Strongyloides ratti]
MIISNDKITNNKKRRQTSIIFGGEKIRKINLNNSFESESQKFICKEPSINLKNDIKNISSTIQLDSDDLPSYSLEINKEMDGIKNCEDDFLNSIEKENIDNLKIKNNFTENQELLIYPGLRMLKEISFTVENIFKPLKEIEKTLDMKERFARQAFYSLSCEDKFENTNDLAQQQFQILRNFVEIINETYDMNSYTVIDFKELYQHSSVDIIFNVVINLGKFIKTIDLKTSHFCPGERCTLTFKYMNSKEEKNIETEKIGYIAICYFEDDNKEVDKISIDINFSSEIWSIFTTSEELLSLHENATSVEFSLSSTDKLNYNNPQELKNLLDKAFKTSTGKIISKMLLNNPQELNEEKSYLIDKNLEIKSVTQINEKQKEVIKISLTETPVIFVKSPPGTGKTFIAATIVDNDFTKHTYFIAESNQACNSFANMVKSLNSTKLKPLRLLSKNAEIKKNKDIYYEEEHVINEIMSNIKDKLSFKDKEIVNNYNQLKDKWKNIKWRSTQNHQSLKNHFDEMMKISKKYERIFFKIYKCNLIIMTADYAKKIFQSRSYSKFKPHRIIIDEASQMSLIKYLELFTIYPNIQYIFFGDEKQLPPYIPYSHDSDPKLSKSILAKSIMNIALKTNYSMNLELDCSYRMHPIILKIISKFFYNNKLTCGIDETKRNLITKNFPNLKNPILFINILGTFSEIGNNHSLINDGEAKVVKQLLTFLKTKNISYKDITIISMYKSQVDNIIEKLDKDYTPQICTIDSSQGSENEIIIVCTTKADTSKNTYASSFLKDENRINVAFSRAKSGLFILGDRFCLSEPSIWNDIIRYLSKTKQFCHSENMNLFFS